MYDKKFTSAVICAAGSSSRMKGAAGRSKQLLSFGGMTVLERTVGAFLSDSVTDELVIVCPETLTEEFSRLPVIARAKKPIRFAKGGAERQMSVKNGVDACSERAELIVVHDGARPFITPELIAQVTADGAGFGCATLAVPVKDTIKRAKDEMVTDTPPREELFSIQTPQVFVKSVYLSAYEHAEKLGIVCTDDCRMIELCGGTVKITRGDYNNIKITTPEDIALAGAIAENGREPEERNDNMLRIGHGYDVHKLGENRRLIIGGVDIPYERGLVGHSDADVLTHAIMDALLGAAALGDIGGMFPDNDPKYEGADSILLLKEVCAAIDKKGFSINNIDATVIAQKPKLKPYIEEMRRTIAQASSLDTDCVNIKATTEERLGFTGREEGIAAHAVCLIR